MSRLLEGDRAAELERLERARASLGLRSDAVGDSADEWNDRELAEYLAVAEGPMSYADLVADVMDAWLLARTEARLTRRGLVRMSGCCALTLTANGRAWLGLAPIGGAS